MQTEVLMLSNDRGEFCLGIMTPFGFMPVATFYHVEELRKFGQGIVAYCNEVSPPIPAPFLQAFEGGKDDK